MSRAPHQNPGIELPIYIESLSEQRRHWYTATQGDAVHRHPVKLEEIWNSHDLVPDYLSANWTNVVQQMANDGDTSGAPLAGPPPILTLRKNKPLTNIAGTNKYEVVGPNPIRQVVTATFGLPAPLAPNCGAVVTATAAPTTVQGYTPVIRDAKGAIHPMIASSWVIDGINHYVEFPYGVPSNMVAPFELTYFEYTGTYGGGTSPDTTPLLLYFRKVVPAGAVNFVGAQIVPGPRAADVPASCNIMYGVVVKGSIVDLTTPNQTPEAFSVFYAVASGGVELYSGVTQVRPDVITLASTTGGLATVLLNSSATETRIFSGTVQVEPLTTTAAGTKIV
jgi:hypothetical protein